MNRKDILLDAPCPELLCGFCTDILEDPMQVHCSEDHMFCSSCLADYNDSTCPSCMEPLDKSSFQLSKFVKRQIGRLRVCCVHQSRGCTWEGILENYHLHSQSCQYQSIPCPNSHNGCPDYIKPSDIYQHKLQCPYELISCPNGSTQCQPFLRKESAIHDSNCSSFQCPFAQEGCSYTGTRTDVNQHCGNYCGKLHERIKQLEHQRDQMEQQLHQQHESMDNIIIGNAINDTPIPATAPLSLDTSINEMAILHEMFNNGIMSMTSESNDTNISALSIMNNNNNNNNNSNNTEMMDLSTCLPNISLPTTSSTDQQYHLSEDASDTFESRMVTPATAPKRSSTGKIIRYSKNKHLAHGALRIARQQSSSVSNLTIEAIFPTLHGGCVTSGDVDANMTSSSPTTPTTQTHPSLCSSSSTFSVPTTTVTHTPYASAEQHQHSCTASPSSSSTPVPTSSNSNRTTSKPAYSFKNLDDVTKFLEEFPPVTGDTPSEPRKSGSAKPNVNKMNNERTGKLKKKGGEACTKRSTTLNHVNNPSQQQVISNRPVTDSNKSSDGSPARPMYVLASTLLSKRTQDS